jgi:hypothetical protein
MEPSMDWPGGDLRHLKIPPGLFQAAADGGILAVGVHDGVVGVESRGGEVEVGPGQFAVLDPSMDVASVGDGIPWRPAMDPGDETQWEKDAEKELDESLGIPEGGGGCECLINF